MKNVKNLKNVVLVCLVAMISFGLYSCGSENSSAADDARSRVEATPTANSTAPTASPTAAATPEPAVPAGPTTTINFEETEFDYGTVDQGEKVNHIYKFKNTGSEPLIISNAKGSCGCTVPSWPKEPIPVGGTGEIAVQFDSKGKKGNQSKRVTLTANTDPAQTFLTIKGVVNAPEGEAPAMK